MTYDEWYAKVKKAKNRSLEIAGGDLTSGLESALRRRARADGLGVSIMLDRSPYLGSSQYTVALFPKGEIGPGRKAYLKRASAINRESSERQRGVRRCKSCGAPEKVNAIGYTNIAPFLGVCTDCINKAADATPKDADYILLPRPRNLKVRQGGNTRTRSSAIGGSA